MERPEVEKMVERIMQLIWFIPMENIPTATLDAFDIKCMDVDEAEKAARKVVTEAFDHDKEG